MTNFFVSSINETDPLIGDALNGELDRQQNQLELIASENIVSRAVLDALAHPVTNKTLEGYPGRRFHGGGRYVDVMEQAAIDRAKQLFNCAYVNVQPHSGTQANQAVFFAALKPGDRVLSMNLAAGGHLSHGAKPNLSGRWFEISHYGVDQDTGLIDYEQAFRLAHEVRPRLLIAGGSAYPRKIDFARMATIAAEVGALFLVDMAHIAGLVAAGAHPSPLPHADFVTCTTTKTLRGPRGGLILARDNTWSAKLQSAVFPGVQGSLHTQVLAAKAVCLGEALNPSFRAYGNAVVDNARVLAKTLQNNGIRIVSGGTDTHVVLLDLSAQQVSGQAAQDALEAIGITSNKNPIPFDSNNPSQWRGLRLGVAATTTRGLDQADFALLGKVIARTVLGSSSTQDQQIVQTLCDRYPIYAE